MHNFGFTFVDIKVYKGIFIWLLLTSGVLCFAQEQTVKLQDGEYTSYLFSIDSADAADQLLEEVNRWRSQGYLACTIDSVAWLADTSIAYMQRGPLYEHLLVTKHNLPASFLPQDSQDLYLNLATFSRVQRQLISYYENTGYPFASLDLLNTQTSEDTLKADLRFEPYLRFTYDTLVYFEECDISKKYMAKYIGIEPGKAYNEAALKDVDTKLRNLPLIKVLGPTQIVFYRGLARLILYIENRVTDRIDGVVGLAPNSDNSSSNDLLLTGEVNLELNNLFKSGKELQVHWKNYLQNSQKLDIGTTLPYLLNTRIGLHGEFNLNKFDTLFVNLKGKISVRYQNSGNNYVQLYYQSISSNQLSVDTARFRTTKRLPENNPYQINNYGITVSQRSFDYLPNPRKGFSLLGDVAIGQKQILRNLLVSSVKYTNTNTGEQISIYDTLENQSIRLDIKLGVSAYIPIRKRATIHQSLDIEALFAEQIFFNELYNFGGFATLKGFDENELFASKSLRYTLAYKYLIGENSHVGLFGNLALIENSLLSDDLVYDTPYGFGALANIQVGKGILSLAYALGSQQGNPINLSNAKFHFGLVNYF